GKLDLVFGDGGIAIHVLMGVGNGTFGPDTYFGTKAGPASVLLADLDGDGILDAASADYGYAVHGWGASVLFGIGDGTFSPALNYGYELSPYPVSISAGDLNGDRRVDLVAVSETSGRVTTLTNNGDRTFRTSGQGLF